MLDCYDRLEVYRNDAWIDEHKVLSPSEIQQGLQLCAELDAVRCHSVRSYGDMILFFPMVSFFLPHPPGVLYSTHDADPNVTNTDHVAPGRPFKKLQRHWYSSMAMRPRRLSGW